MSESQKPVAAAKRVAPSRNTKKPASAAGMPNAVAAQARRSPARQPSREDEAVARHQKELADALQKAMAINDAPKLEQPAVVESGKSAKAKKPKLVRDSFAMPQAEYARIGELKKRLAAMDAAAKKNELLRAGLALLAAMGDAELKAVVGKVERIKTGRPAKNPGK